jgi:hypothetical protein
MTDSNQTPAAAVLAVPTQASVQARFHDLLLEIDHLQAHRGTTPLLHAAREAILRATAPATETTLSIDTASAAASH